jgi:hypothetical protein
MLDISQVAVQPKETLMFSAYPTIVARWAE